MIVGPEAIEAAAQSLATMIIEYVDDGTKMRLDWRLSIARVIALRLARFFPGSPSPQPTQSDEERARDLEKYGRYSTKGDSEEMVAVYMRALTAVRAEASAAKDAEIAKLEWALREARPFMDYFANGHREFVGPGTPTSCLAHIDWALNQNAEPASPSPITSDISHENSI